MARLIDCCGKRCNCVGFPTVVNAIRIGKNDQNGTAYIIGCSRKGCSKAARARTGMYTCDWLCLSREYVPNNLEFPNFQSRSALAYHVKVYHKTYQTDNCLRTRMKILHNPRLPIMTTITNVHGSTLITVTCFGMTNWTKMQQLMFWITKTDYLIPNLQRRTNSVLTPYANTQR